MTFASEHLSRRLAGVQNALVDLARCVDENLRCVLLLMTTEDLLEEGLELRSTRAYEDAVMQRCMELLALEGPMAQDLRWAFAVIRVGKDYERTQSLVEALATRVRGLSDTLLEDILHAMTDVMREILGLHAILLDLWRSGGAWTAEQELRLEAQATRVEYWLGEAEDRAIQAMMKGEESAENLRELVLANRHLKRITDQLVLMPEELRRARIGPDRG